MYNGSNCGCNWVLCVGNRYRYIMNMFWLQLAVMGMIVVGVMIGIVAGAFDHDIN